MQDDVYLLVQEGWKAVLDGKPNTDLVPPALIVARYFAVEQAAIEQLEVARDAVTRQMEELDEEHGGEEGLLADARTDKGKLTAKSAKERLKAIKDDEDEERKVLDSYLASSAGIRCRQASEDAQRSRRQGRGECGRPSEAEVKTLVVDDKWVTAHPASGRPNST
jgi:type I restriction enzyme M protein